MPVRFAAYGAHKGKQDRAYKSCCCARVHREACDYRRVIGAYLYTECEPETYFVYLITNGKKSGSINFIVRIVPKRPRTVPQLQHNHRSISKCRKSPSQRKYGVRPG